MTYRECRAVPLSQTRDRKHTFQPRGRSMIVPTETYISSTDAVCDPTPYCGTSTSAVPYKTHIFSTNIHFIQPPAAGAPRRSPTNPLMRLSVGEGCSPLGRRHEVTVGEASPPRNAPPENHSVQRHLPRSKSILP